MAAPAVEVGVVGVGGSGEETVGIGDTGERCGEVEDVAVVEVRDGLRVGSMLITGDSGR